MMNGKLSLPLFPLNTVLFPGQVLPLHIFEPRYREMIGKCIEHSWPFGVVLIQEDKGATLATPHEVGTTARITQVENLEDGRMNIVTVGEMRFRILAMEQEAAGYWRGDVTLWPWLHSDESEASQLATRVSNRLRSYVTLLAQVSGLALEADDLPHQPTALACLTAIALQVELAEKQDLLVSPSIVALLSKETGLLQREVRAMQIILGSHGRPTSDDSLNHAPAGHPPILISPN